MAPTKDIPIGTRFERLVVLSKNPTKGANGAVWDCLCDCGNKISLKGTQLRGKKTRSCGCLQRELAKQLRTGLPSPKQLPNGVAAFNLIFKKYKSDAFKREFCFELTSANVEILFKGNCGYCGIAPFRTSKPSPTTGEYIYNGIDRIDSSVGYVLDNVISCCKECNFAKAKRSINDYRNWIERSYITMFGDKNE